jgi:3-oxo-4,17-pregnadiene-20-carboxyl-CoA hydratase alpha subunit
MTDPAALAEKLIASGQSAPRVGRDPVNLPMIRNWLEALGDANPVYESSQVAPPAMIQVWTMRGLHRIAEDEDPLGAISQAFAEAGYPSIVATNCEQTYHRYLRVGESVSVRSRLVSVVGPKRTALGEGYFITTESTWYAGDEAVATMMFRVLRYRPAEAAVRLADPARSIRPAVNQDTAFFWEGMRLGELRIQRCDSCQRLRHPPGPACPSCGSLELSYVVSSGAGTVFSYVVHHYPAVPGRSTPFVVALVELAEGVRMLGQLLDAPADAVTIGALVELAPEKVDDELTLPAWRLSEEKR